MNCQKNNKDQKSQRVYQELTVRNIRVESYRLLNQFVRKGQIVLAGSSLAEQFPVNELLNQTENRYIVYNRGISGDTTYDLLNTMNECIFDLEPSKIFINIGTNDIGRADYSEDTLIQNYISILAQIKERLPQSIIYVLSYYPVNSDLAFIPEEQRKSMFATRTNEAINRANERVMCMASDLGCEYIDVHSILLNSMGSLDEKYTVEGIHLYPNAYQLILQTLIRYF